MSIKTKEFNISEEELRQVTRIVYYRTLKILLILMAIFSLIIVIESIILPSLTLIAIGFVAALGYYLVFPFIRNPSKTQPKLNFKNRICELTDNYFNTTYEDGSLRKVHFSNYLKVTRESDWYFLYLTKVMFEYVPIRAFNSENDINEFETLMKSKKLME